MNSAYNFNPYIRASAHKGHILRFLEWSLYTGLTVLILFHMKRFCTINNIELGMLEKLGYLIRNRNCFAFACNRSGSPQIYFVESVLLICSLCCVFVCLRSVSRIECCSCLWNVHFGFYQCLLKTIKLIQEQSTSYFMTP